MATGTYAPYIPQQYFDNDGNPLSLGNIYTYIAGTTTPLVTYSAIDLSVQNANPVPLNPYGRPASGAIVLVPGTSYKFVVKDSNGTTLATYDNISAVPASSSNNDINGVAGETLTTGQWCYLSDGSGGKVAGQWYKTDASNAYSSTLPQVGMVPTTITSGATGTVRIGGSATGQSVSPGSDYYLSQSTAGALTPTAPSNARLVGRADSASTLTMVVSTTPSIPDNTACNGRLTLNSGNPVTTADVTAATTVYFTPYKGSRIALWDGTKWAMHSFTELSIPVPATTSQMYDVFVYDNSGTCALELAAWTSDTTRASAVGFINGVYTKTSNTTRRYVGSFRTTTVSGQTEDSVSKRYLWNYTHRVVRPLFKSAASNFTSASTNYTQANAAYQVDVVIGMQEDPVTVNLFCRASSDGGAASTYNQAIGVDSTTVATAEQAAYGAGANIYQGMTVLLNYYPQIGRHFFAWLVKVGSNTGTFYGTDAGAGLTGFVMG